MAGDWIKMRTDLYRDPKVIVIAEHLSDNVSKLSRYVSQNTQCDMCVTRNVMRNVTVGALVSIWGVSRHQGRRVNNDLLMEGVTISVLDDICDIPGFGEAMRLAGWVVESEDGVVFPKFFEENNADPKSKALSNAERQKKYRDRQKGNQGHHEKGVTKVTVSNENVTQSNGRIEESREDKKQRVNDKHSQYTETFENFWVNYPKPRRREKQDAFKAWKVLVAKGVDESMLIEKAREYAESDLGSGQYSKMPASWLRAGAYEDDTECWSDSTAKPSKPEVPIEYQPRRFS